MSLGGHAGSPASCDLRRSLSQFPAELSVVLVARTLLEDEDEEKRNPIAGDGWYLPIQLLSNPFAIARSLESRLGNTNHNGGPAQGRISTAVHMDA